MTSPKLLSACVAWSLNGSLKAEDPAAVRTQARETADWTAFLNLAAESGLAPLAASCLDSCQAPVPSTVSQTLAAHFRENAKRLLVLTGELKRVLELLEAAGVEAIALKGPTLAHAFYPEPAWRVFTDLDLLIPPEQLSATRRLLAQDGYEETGDAHLRAARNAFLGWYTELHLVHKSRRTCLDLHWDSAPLGFPGKQNANELRNRAEIFPLEGQPVRVLCPEDNFIYLCLHAAKHDWSNPIWLLDLCHLARASTFNYQKILHRASSSPTALKIVEFGHALGPAAINVAAPRLATRRETALLALRLALVPTEADWSSLRISSPRLYFLYFPWRWFRLALKRFQYPRTGRADAVRR